MSGGQAGVYEESAYKLDSGVFELNVPILGIYYGMQYIADFFGGKVVRAKAQEFGKARLEILESCGIFEGIKRDCVVWMSHADKVEQIPQGFSELAKSGNKHYCAIANEERKIYALQFHPEVVHSEYGGEILKNFALHIFGADDSWNMHNFAETEIRKLCKIVLGDSIEGDHVGLDSGDYEHKCRCQWAKVGNPNDERIYWAYHDGEWGVPLNDDMKLFEFLVLEGFQAGLSWLTILKKRESFREAFDSFDPKLVAKYDEAKILNLMENEGIIRNRLKIESAINNAQKFLEIQKEFGSFDAFIWSYVSNKPIINAFENHDEIPTNTSLSDKISQDLESRGFKFVGSTIIYAFMQAVGMVNDHLSSCFVRKNLVTQSAQKGIVQGSGKVLCAVSGGVDSSVMATLLYRAIGEALIPVFVDTGLLRKGEKEAVEAMFRENLKVPLIVCDASELFLSRLKGVVDPEQKRKIIEETFIEVFESEAKKA